MNTNKTILSINNLLVKLYKDNTSLNAVNDVSISLNEGETVAIVGESGSGKSTLALSIMGLLPKISKNNIQGIINFEGTNLLNISSKKLAKIRGNEISIIFQDPLTSLNPIKKIGSQITESILKHQNISKDNANRNAVKLLSQVGIKNPKSRLYQYPHNFSGGMRQRVMIAMAISNNPKILIADEPTTSLDVTIQLQIVNLLKSIQKNTGMSVVWITHDLALASRVANRIIVMYAGKIVEEAPTEVLYKKPKHPYTVSLLQSIPQLNSKRMSRSIALEVALMILLE